MTTPAQDPPIGPFALDIVEARGPISDVQQALNRLSRDDLDALTIEELKRLESDLQAWANLAMVAAMTKRAAIRDEASE